jgi:hypothetical protein
MHAGMKQKCFQHLNQREPEELRISFLFGGKKFDPKIFGRSFNEFA